VLLTGASAGIGHTAMTRGGDPRQVARLIVRVARARSPVLRDGAGAEALALPSLKMLLPQRLFDVLLRRGFGLKPRGRA
jgi:hypothetical protein